MGSRPPSVLGPGWQGRWWLPAAQAGVQHGAALPPWTAQTRWPCSTSAWLQRPASKMLRTALLPRLQARALPALCCRYHGCEHR